MNQNAIRNMSLQHLARIFMTVLVCSCIVSGMYGCKRDPEARMNKHLGRGIVYFEQDKPGENETSTDAYTRVDAAIYFKTPAGKGEFTVFLKGNNLSNAEIRNSTSFLRDYAPEPGRGAELGLRYSL